MTLAPSKALEETIGDRRRAAPIRPFTGEVGPSKVTPAPLCRLIAIRKPDGSYRHQWYDPRTRRFCKAPVVVTPASGIPNTPATNNGDRGGHRERRTLGSGIKPPKLPSAITSNTSAIDYSRLSLDELYFPSQKVSTPVVSAPGAGVQTVSGQSAATQLEGNGLGQRSGERYNTAELETTATGGEDRRDLPQGNCSLSPPAVSVSDSSKDCPPLASAQLPSAIQRSNTEPLGTAATVWRLRPEAAHFGSPATDPSLVRLFGIRLANRIQRAAYDTLFDYSIFSSATFGRPLLGGILRPATAPSKQHSPSRPSENQIASQKPTPSQALGGDSDPSTPREVKNSGGWFGAVCSQLRRTAYQITFNIAASSKRLYGEPLLWGRLRLD